MSVGNQDEKGWRGFLRQTSLTGRLMLAAFAITTVAGSALAGHGVYMKAKAGLSQVLMSRAFAETVATGRPVKPWAWADFTLMAEISVPRIDASAIVVDGVSGEAMAFGPAHMSNTPNPGEEGTAVIAAHRDSHFAWLKNVHKGDRVDVIGRDGKTLSFAVTGMRIAKWNHSGVDANALGRHMALVTCWPLDSKFRGDLRYIVETEMIDDSRTAKNDAGATSLPGA